MKMIPEKLQEVGYYTVQCGKWHLGLAQQAFTPAGRGFNESLTMLAGSENHFDQRDGLSLAGQRSIKHVDLWATDQPALGHNGTYSAELFGSYAVDAIRSHHNSRRGQPLFMYIAFTITHSPEQAPQRFIDLYPVSWLEGRRTYLGMASALDEAVRNVTDALKATDMWKSSLVVFSSDNGGPSLVGGSSFANNYPLRGGKGNAFEGGTRVLTLVSGGLIPTSQFHRKLPTSGHVHFADWYATFCELSGHAECMDAPGGGVPSTESHNMWPLLFGQTDASPRTETVLEYRLGKDNFDGALLQGDLNTLSAGRRAPATGGVPSTPTRRPSCQWTRLAARQAACTTSPLTRPSITTSRPCTQT